MAHVHSGSISPDSNGRVTLITYILTDGDDIGNKLELMLLDGDIDSAKRFSQEVERAVRESAAIITTMLGSELVFIGGDGFLAIVPSSELNTNMGQQMQARFREACGCTLSVGTGPDARAATNALRRAKLLGKNRVISVG